MADPLKVSQLKKGDRVRINHGARQGTKDGTVTLVYENDGAKATVKMDNGRNEVISGEETLQGIGWRRIVEGVGQT